MTKSIATVPRIRPAVLSLQLLVLLPVHDSRDGLHGMCSGTRVAGDFCTA